MLLLHLGNAEANSGAWRPIAHRQAAIEKCSGFRKQNYPLAVAGRRNVNAHPLRSPQLRRSPSARGIVRAET